MNLTSTDDLTSNLWMHYGELHTLSRFHSFKHTWALHNSIIILRFAETIFYGCINVKNVFIIIFLNFVSSKNISSLRHPDGASNPNLQSETCREPGNGAEESKDKKSQGSDEGDIEEVPYPPPLQSELLSLSRDGWAKFKVVAIACGVLP